MGFTAHQYKNAFLRRIKCIKNMFYMHEVKNESTVLNRKKVGYEMKYANQRQSEDGHHKTNSLSLSTNQI